MNNQEHIIENEQSLIAACLHDRKVLAEINDIVDPYDFMVPIHQTIFKTASHLLASAEPIDPLSIAEAAGNNDPNFDRAYLARFFDTVYADTKSAIYHARNIKEAANRRALQMSLKLWADQSLNQNSNEFIANIQSQLGAMLGTEASTVKHIKHFMKEVIEDLDRRQKNGGELDGLSTGLKRLDDRWEGMKPGQLIVLAARPSMGKSLIGAHIATSAAQKGTVLMFSLEMTGADLLRRELAAKGNITLSGFKNPNHEGNESWWHGLQAGAAKLKTCELLIDETAGLHINQILARARIQHQRNPLSLVVIDHIHIVAVDGKQSREREMAEISWKLKALAKELGCPVLAVAQLNRNVEQRADKRPQMSDLRDSGSIEQDADIVAMVYRDDYYNDQSEFKGTVEILTKKNRSGAVGDDRFSIQLDRSKISDLANDYQEPDPVNEHWEV